MVSILTAVGATVCTVCFVLCNPPRCLESGAALVFPLVLWYQWSSGWHMPSAQPHWNAWCTACNSASAHILWCSSSLNETQTIYSFNMWAKGSMSNAAFFREDLEIASMSSCFESQWKNRGNTFSIVFFFPLWTQVRSCIHLWPREKSKLCLSAVQIYRATCFLRLWDTTHPQQIFRLSVPRSVRIQPGDRHVQK